MPTKSDNTTVALHVALGGATPEDKLELLQAALFDRHGALVAHTQLKLSLDGAALGGRGQLKAAPEQLQSGRLVIAPVTDTGGGETPDRTMLEKQLAGYTVPVRLAPREPRLEVKIPRPYWERWPRLCICWIRGRLVKRVALPDGQVLDLPVCHARVTVCEVDRWWLILERLPLRDLLRLREDLLDLIEFVPPLPEPEPDPFPHALDGLMLRQQAPRLGAPRANKANDARLRTAVTGLRAGSAALLRADLLAHLDVLRPYFCWLPWLEPWFVYTKQCFGPVATDEQGRFSFLYVHDCADRDQPDIYVSAEQFLGGSWTTIHAPPVRCHTIWNYHCGDEITVVITDPRAQPCIPDVPTEPPPGVDRWVMPMAIGGTWVRGTAATGAHPAGWVRPDGMTSYGAYLNAPFGGTLGFRQQHALSIPNVGANGQYYYRWSFRRGTTGSFTRMLDPVSRTYVRDVPGPGVQFPAVQLGPLPGELFRFKPALFSPADWSVPTAGDPPGTQYYWPVDNSIGDLYAARWTTPGAADAVAAPGLADDYQVKLEVFDSLGNLVMPGPATFSFVVPESFVGATLLTRPAAPSELDGAGFVFTVHVDNSRCAANIRPPSLSSGADVDDCGFLRYGAGTSLTLAFDALHPHNHATYSFALTRGALAVPAASAGGEVGAASSGAYVSAGDGEFSHAFAVGVLLGPVPGHPGSCANAAFAATLDLDAKATDGTTRLSQYDAGAVRAFALAEE